jgi:hypothetical protein
MEKRASKRIDCSLNAEVTTRGSLYPITVENFSNGGMHVVMPTEKTVEDFIPGATVGVNFQAPTGEWINQHCTIKWLKINTEPQDSIIYNIGLQVIAPPPQFKEVYDYLSKK